MRARLCVHSGDAIPPNYDLDTARSITLGRHSGNTIILQDKHASRWHAEIYPEAGRWFIRDCGTMNGTRLNGQRIRQPVPLDHGFFIAIGDTRFRFTQADEDGSGTQFAAVPSAAPAADGDAEQGTVEFREDDLTALCTFMAQSVEDATSWDLITRALQTIQRQTSAVATGFHTLDPDVGPPKIVVPEMTQVDIHLSRQLTEQAQRDGRSLWLAGRRLDGDSHFAFHDALVVLVRGDRDHLGAIHAYRAGGTFHEGAVRFAEVVSTHLGNCLQRLRRCRTLEAENSRLRVQANPDGEELIGDSQPQRQLRAHLTRVAQRSSVVYLQGETGSGKELAALAIHRQGPRRDGPYVAFNTAAIPSELVESHLFGHVKGGFTSAINDRRGLFEMADQGTLFLDEIGDLPLGCQAKLLRVLEGKGFFPVGGEKEIKPDVRVVVATHRDLRKEKEAGRFREDLYYRLNLPIRVPPLREHVEDIPMLVELFLGRLAPGRNLRATTEALDRLCQAPWPGNVRQLLSVLEHAVTHTDGSVIDVTDLPLGAEEEQEASDLNLERVEERAIRDALARTGYVQAHAAKILGVSRDTVIAKMKKYRIERPTG